MTKHLNIVFDADYRATSSTDIRINYDRIMYSLGVEWQQ
jgi:hypothetical protein